MGNCAGIDWASEKHDVLIEHPAGEELLAATFAHDEDGVSALCATLACYEVEVAAPGAQVSGRDNVIGFLGAFHEAFPDGRLEVKQLLSDGPAAAVEGTFVGTHDGVLHTPNGDVAPTGRAIEFRWAAVYATDGDTLKSEHLFFDQMDFLGQLGLLPD
jgi:predicted ester cyclase